MIKNLLSLKGAVAVACVLFLSGVVWMSSKRDSSSRVHFEKTSVANGKDSVPSVVRSEVLSSVRATERVKSISRVQKPLLADSTRLGVVKPAESSPAPVRKQPTAVAIVRPIKI